MPVERLHASEAPAANADHSKVFDTISTQVLQSLGEPDHLHSVNVRRLWGQRFRVNIYVGRDASAITVAHSYFLVADAEGKIISSDPVIKRTYGIEMFRGPRTAMEGQTP